MATYPCQLCGKILLTLEKFTIHTYSHTGERPYKCLQQGCAKGFISKYKLIRHMATHSPQKSHQCVHCEKTFHRKDHLKNHLQTHDPNKMAFGCDECGKKYNTKLGYKRHLALHAASSGDLTCRVCALELGSTEVLLDHLKAHAGGKPPPGAKEKKHQCDHCERCFYTRKDVRRHLVVHTGCKDFLCQFCAQRFGRKDHLTRHTKKTHSQELMKDRLQNGDLLSSRDPHSPPFQLHEGAATAAPTPFSLGVCGQNGLGSGLPAEGQNPPSGPYEQGLRHSHPLPEALAAIQPSGSPESPPCSLQPPEYDPGSTSYSPLPHPKNLPLKTASKGFCNMNLLEELVLQEPHSAARGSPDLDLSKGIVDRLNINKEMAMPEVMNRAAASPASLDLSHFLGLWQLPPSLTQNVHGNSAMSLGPRESLPHRLSRLGPQQQEPQLAMGSLTLNQLHIPHIPHTFPASPSSTILPHFHHAFR
ncbi:zinc finger protein PLAGL1 isoform X1 [Monodelphis domestica]|uniref:Zinc finger protein PLAGL1 n=2 Tax=Monodelphis domestica TaxID=13616 RepID=F6TKQ9_MONDO|nr:zinc finger protein PLAGL1 isoform X1 [Monodelphis domestica]XP_007484727.1 zinc finger protein PLAGL1 isoform X1 [Monodelphis domestica]XP_007484730.1 zinc finger protein PLAGL1 isoform X1 [Monodelphis domestica]XP_007484731.1 zinc finger protein PLAGL1 isoform X1 [Monodelphis domestica]XP_007484733.1 zinc finger protein PLAGL1 isoform X1 [Monodelphis domestica]XP_016284411.1 zinc finger protein PLAGL1 isoform X1 [Monodelphis domestica]XP_016284412.1 zinc finger protein PLAGL1 isoform X1 